MNKEQIQPTIQKNIKDAVVHRIGGDYEGGFKGVAKDRMLKDYHSGAQIASEVYEPLLAAKDKRIEELEKELERRTKLLRAFIVPDGVPNEPIWDGFCKEYNINQ